MASASTAITEIRSGNYKRFLYAHEYIAFLHDLWEPPVEVARDWVREDSDVSYSRRLSELERTHWSIAFTPTFCKSIANMDKAVQGRILTALTSLSAGPDTLRGDTNKPLLGKLKGLWRYRIGDYRLVYQPQELGKTIFLVDFGARGGIYD